MLENTVKKDDSEMVTLKSLSDLTGFPEEMIKSELFANNSENGESINLESLRAAMMSYIDKTMLAETAE